MKFRLLLSFALCLICVCCNQSSNLYYWGDFEAAGHERYTNEQSAEVDTYVLQTINNAEKQHLRVPPGVYADYGFLMFRRGDTASAKAYFTKEMQMFPESKALMTKLIERIDSKDKEVSLKNTPPELPLPGSKP